MRMPSKISSFFLNFIFQKAEAYQCVYVCEPCACADTSRSGSSGAAGPSDRRARPSPPSPVNGAATSSAPPPTSGFLSFNRLSELNDPSIDFTEKLVKKKPATTEEETSPRGGAE